MTEIQSKLLKRNAIDISGRITPETSGYVREALQDRYANGVPQILITINSGGGSAYAGLDIYDMIKFYPGSTIGVALVAAGSAACTILQACTWRVATRNAHILIHHTKFDISWDVLTDPKKRDVFIESNRHLLNSKEILARRTSKNLDQIFEKCSDDNWINAGEALEFGLLDQLVETADEIRFPDAKQ